MATLQNGDRIRCFGKTGKLLRLPESLDDKGLVHFDGEDKPVELSRHAFSEMDKWAYPLGWV